MTGTLVSPPCARYDSVSAQSSDRIRVAHSDEIEGPWTIHPGGCLHLADSCSLTRSPEATPAVIANLRSAFARFLGPDHLPDELVTDSVTPHIASPDVHVDHVNRRFVMCFHGLDSLAAQVTRAAVSRDGLNFRARPEVLGGPYMRAFTLRDHTYALTMPGHFSRSISGLGGFPDRNLRSRIDVGADWHEWEVTGESGIALADIES